MEILDSSAFTYRTRERLTILDSTSYIFLPGRFFCGKLIRDHAPLRLKAVVFSGATAG